MKKVLACLQVLIPLTFRMASVSSENARNGFEREKRIELARY